jgi:hypothetical protein
MNVSTPGPVAVYNAEVAVAIAAVSARSTTLAGMVSTESDTASLLSSLVNEEDEYERTGRETVSSSQTGRNIDFRA